MKKIFTILFLTTQLIYSRNDFLHEFDSDKIKKSFIVQQGGVLDVNICGGDVTLKAWDKNEILIEIEGIEKENSEKLKIYNEENKVIINYRPHWSWDAARFEITIPKNFNAEINTAGGNINLDGEFTGVINSSTSGGDITTRHVNGNGKFKTSGGDIVCEKITGDGYVRTSGGDIIFKTVGKKIDAYTSGGDIEIGKIDGDGIVKTSGGDIQIGNVLGELSAITSGGSLDIGEVLSNVNLKTSGGDIFLIKATGNVNAKTSGGNIKLKKIFGNVDAKTSGGDVECELYPDGMSSLETSGGNIKISFSPDTKATIISLIEKKWRWKPDNNIFSDFKMDYYSNDDKTIQSTININGGGKVVSLKTTNGSIIVKKINK